MSAGVWNWINECARAWQAADDEEHLPLAYLFDEGYQYRETEPELALALFTEGRGLAEQLDEPWWVLFYDCARVVAYLHFLRDFRPVLDLAVKCTIEVRKPGFAQYPGQFDVFDNLIAAYLGIDAEGHADAITPALDYVETILPPGPDSSRYLLLARRRMFAIERGQFAEALAATQRELALADADSDATNALHFSVFAYCGLCTIAFGQRDWEALRGYAETAEELARRKGHQCELAEAQAWQAVAARQQGLVEEARLACRRARRRQQRLQMPPKQGWYDALAFYFELNEEPAKALKVRNRELADIGGKGRLLYECRTHLKRCRLLKQVDRLRPRHLDAARAAARKLRLGSKYLEEIEQIAGAE